MSSIQKYVFAIALVVGMVASAAVTTSTEASAARDNAGQTKCISGSNYWFSWGPEDGYYVTATTKDIGNWGGVTCNTVKSSLRRMWSPEQCVEGQEYGHPWGTYIVSGSARTGSASVSTTVEFHPANEAFSWHMAPNDGIGFGLLFCS